MAGQGAHTQLAAVGIQDVPLTVGFQPSSTHSANFLRYEPFAMCEADVNFAVPVTFGSTVSVTFPFSMADLLGSVYLHVVLPVVGPACFWRPNVGYNMIQRLQLIVGDVTVDDLDGLQHIVHDTLHLTHDQKRAVAELVGAHALPSTQQQELLIPLQLFFTRQGQGLPLVAMTKSKLQLNLTLPPLTELLQGADPPAAVGEVAVSLGVETVTLSGEERTRILTETQDLLIERTLSQQYTTALVTNNHDVLIKPDMQVDLSFMKGSVKQVQLVFVDALGGLVQALGSCALFVNNVQQGDTRVGDRFLSAESFSHCVGTTPLPVYSINFALQASYLQPSGLLDMTQAPSCFLKLTLNSTVPLTLHVYSIAYTTLNFQNGFVS